MKTAALVSLLLLVAFLGLAAAQDAGPRGASVPALLEDAGPVSIAVPAADNPVDTAKSIYTAIKSGAWMPAFGMFLVLLTWTIRKLAGNIHGWFDTKWGGYTVAVVTSLTATIGGSLAAGEPISIGIAMTALSVVWVQSGGWEMLRDLFGAKAKPQ